MRTMPLPVRVAAGLMVTALQRARKLPEQIAELPVTAASRAVQAGMRVQQRVTELAIKGDEVFSLFQQVEDTPPWARFDEEDGADPPGTDPAQSSTNGASGAANDDSLAAVLPGPGAGRRDEIDESDVAREMAPEHPTPTGRADTTTARAPEAGAPPALHGYDELSLAQLRGRLRALSLAELEALLEHEHAHQDRAPFVTMLSNRIVTVRTR